MSEEKTINDVFEETIAAYGDLHDKPDRNLSFLASRWVARDVAYFVMRHAVPSYNDFRPELLKSLPANSLVRIGRAGSVLLYVICDEDSNLDALAADEAESAPIMGGSSVWRLWWG